MKRKAKKEVWRVTVSKETSRTRCYEKPLHYILPKRSIISFLKAVKQYKKDQLYYSHEGSWTRSHLYLRKVGVRWAYASYHILVGKSSAGITYLEEKLYFPKELPR